MFVIKRFSKFMDTVSKRNSLMRLVWKANNRMHIIKEKEKNRTSTEAQIGGGWRRISTDRHNNLIINRIEKKNPSWWI